MKKLYSIGIGTIGTVLLSLGIGSTVIMAPGATALGHELGWQTQTQARETIEGIAKNHEVVIDGNRVDIEDLGYSVVVDLGKYRAASVNHWNEKVPVQVEVNAQVEQNLKNLAPPVMPISASVSYKDGDWVVSDSEDGRSTDIQSLTNAINENLSKDKNLTTFAREVIEPDITTEEADAFVTRAQDASAGAAVLLDDEQVFEISEDKYMSLFTVDASGDDLLIVPDSAAINELVYTVAEETKSSAQNGSAVVDEEGKVLKVLDEYRDGREMNLAQMEDLYNQIAAGVVDGKNQFTVEMDVVKAEVDKKFRRAVVDKAARQAIFYENEQEVYRFPVAIGRPATPTDSGEFKVHAQLRLQDMGCSPDYDYCTKDVPWISYYNGGEAFHGAPWHNDFGDPSGSLRSHGCVNMYVEDAKNVYFFLQVGSPVKVL